MKVYKIQNKNGLFSTGGTCPSFTKDGKMWTRLGSLKSHLTLYYSKRNNLNYPKINAYVDCVVLEYELKAPSEINLESLVN